MLDSHTQEICCTDPEREIWNMQISKHEIFAYLTQSQLSLSVISVHKNVFSKDTCYSMTFWSIQNNYATTSVMLDVKTVVCESVVVIHKVSTSDQWISIFKLQAENVH